MISNMTIMVSRKESCLSSNGVVWTDFELAFNIEKKLQKISNLGVGDTNRRLKSIIVKSVTRSTRFRFKK